MMPEELRPASIAMVRNDKAIAFFLKHSPISNHAHTPFRLVGNSYATMEQFLKRARTLLSKDRRMIRRIMEYEDRVEHKKCLSIMKSDVKEELWRSTVVNWLKPGFTSKLAQNKLALDFLLSTGSRKIGEASMDEHWGIGRKLSE